MAEAENCIPWEKDKVRCNLSKAFADNSELELLSLIKGNSFLLYELYSHKYGIQPAFHEVSFGTNLRCDFTWLNDNSDGPERVLVEIEKPKLEIFKKNGEPTYQLNHAIEQVKSWRRYFQEIPAEKRRIFGAVCRFRYILVAGCRKDWQNAYAAKWRIDNNNETNIEIRSSDIFYDAIDVLDQHPEEFWSFAENPKTLFPSELENYYKGYQYMDFWRKIL